MPDVPANTALLQEELLIRYVPQVRLHIRAMVRDPGAAEELTQETFVRALAGAQSLRDPQAALGWLYRIATNVCLDHLRRQRTAPVPVESDALTEDEAGGSAGKGQPASLIEAALERTDMSACVQRYLVTLPDDYRVALYLRDVYGLSNPEVAELLDCSLATAKIRVHRARKRLHEVLDAACIVSVDERGVVVCDPQ